ncbi:MAG: helix-turn-helix transcriptional regulator [Lachnospiraceae bacterium]|nr:helix-turn-helix transcriptional regulator [Lachnospiraceae bacterium]
MESPEHRKAILAGNLKGFLSANGWNEREAAHRAGINPQTLNSWTNRISYPSMENLIKLADLFHCHIFELTEEKWFIDERKRFLTIAASDMLALFAANPQYALWCRLGTRLARFNRLEVYIKKIEDELS